MFKKEYQNIIVVLTPEEYNQLSAEVDKAVNLRQDELSILQALKKTDKLDIALQQLSSINTLTKDFKDLVTKIKEYGLQCLLNLRDILCNALDLSDHDIGMRLSDLKTIVVGLYKPEGINQYAAGRFDQTINLIIGLVEYENNNAKIALSMIEDEKKEMRKRAEQIKRSLPDGIQVAKEALNNFDNYLEFFKQKKRDEEFSSGEPTILDYEDHSARGGTMDIRHAPLEYRLLRWLFIAIFKYPNHAHEVEALQKQIQQLKKEITKEVFREMFKHRPEAIDIEKIINSEGTFGVIEIITKQDKDARYTEAFYEQEHSPAYKDRLKDLLRTAIKLAEEILKE